MTVSELITRLQQLDPELEIQVYDPYDDEGTSYALDGVAEASTPGIAYLHMGDRTGGEEL